MPSAQRLGTASILFLTTAASGLHGGQCEWSALPGGGLSSNVQTLGAFTIGGSTAVYAGGDFTSAGGAPAVRIARWDPQMGQWSPLGAGMSSTVRALAVFDDGGGAALYAGGLFTSAGGTSGINRIARWDHATGQWVQLGSGLGSGVYSLAVFDPGAGAGLYVGGAFTTAGGAPARSIARWDAQTGWSPLANGTGGTVLALAVYNDGSGAALFAGGTFAPGGGGVAPYIARWDGAAWSGVGSGMNGQVETLTVFDDGLGGGPALYAGGFFTSAGGIAANRVARWNGQAWSALSSGVGGGVYTLQAFDDGSGPALYVGGTFSTAGGSPANRIAKWDGQSWSALGAGTGNVVSALAVLETGSAAGLYAAGAFTTAGGQAAERIARWSCAPAPCFANCDGSTVPPILNVEDFSCFINEFAQASQLPAPQQLLHYANCDLSTTPPVLNVEDFTCFINRFAAGCP
jgi:trimeric autotransporter adhesin